jgi:integrase
MNLKDILKVGPEHVHEYLEYRSIVDQISWRTFQLESAALNKFDDVLNRFCEKQGIDQPRFDFSKVIADAKAEFRDLLTAKSDSLSNRAYGDPESIGNRIKDNDHSLAWKLAMEGGGRISEVSFIREAQLFGIEQDAYTGKDVGRIMIKGKGGLARRLSVTPKTYHQLEKALDRNDGLFKVDQDGLRSSVRSAAGDEYEGRGVHGARYNYSQDRYVELTRIGYSHEQTISIISRELGHHRADITMRYLCM